MRYLRFCFLSITLLFALAGTALAASSPVDKLSSFLQKFSTYSATFKQTTETHSGRVVQKSSGKIFIMRPGKFRWEADSPTKQIIITDGENLWVYDVDLQQATEQALDKRVSVNPAILLTGSVKNLKELFQVTMSKQGGASVFILQPKKQGFGFQKMTLTFLKGELVQMVVVNQLNQITHFNFSNIELNKKLSPSLFNFKPPAGVDIIRQ
jgi:outer membrane lipoprotein carrier protein